MVKNSITLLDKINKLEQRKKELLEQRKEELWGVFIKCKAVSIEDKLLTSFLNFAMNPLNKDSDLLIEISKLGLKAGENKLPSKSLNN